MGVAVDNVDVMSEPQGDEVEDRSWLHPIQNLVHSGYCMFHLRGFLSRALCYCSRSFLFGDSTTHGVNLW